MNRTKSPTLRDLGSGMSSGFSLAVCGDAITTTAAGRASLAEIGRASNLQTAGASYAELGRLEGAEKRYAEMKSTLDRLHFAAGVICGLQP
jgi:hypothetical protein